MAKRREKRVGKKKTTSRQKRNIDLKPKTDGQKHYMDLIEDNDVTICNGPAGSGKTIVAVGMALKLLKDKPDKYKRIIMVRPAVTVKGEDLGYLPGDIDEKMKPFMVPMLDSIKCFLQMSDIISMLELGIIEICPIGYMRGRSLNNCVMILDEAQNSTAAQMKMVITRIGFNTKMIIEGDVTQSDLDGSSGLDNGLKDAIKRFGNVDGVGVCVLEAKDIVRSPILSRLINTYD